jgi:hypothetical protein
MQACCIDHVTRVYNFCVGHYIAFQYCVTEMPDFFLEQILLPHSNKKEMSVTVYMNLPI